MVIPKHELQTPSLAFTGLGVTALILHHLFGIQKAEFIAFVLFGFVGGGVAMALGSEVERKHREWGWKGLVQSLKHPSKDFWKGFLFHLPQFLIALYLAYNWWHKAQARG